MRPLHRPVLIIATLLLLATGALAIVVAGDEGAARSGKGKPRDPLDIWKIGTRWSVTVTQDGAPVRSDGEGSTITSVYRFKVMKGGSGAGATWVVFAKIDGASGPFGEGWDLYYRRDGRGYTLDRVALAGKKPVDASYASAILGTAFPLETRITETPRSRTEKKTYVAGREGTPPPLPPEGDVMP